MKQPGTFALVTSAIVLALLQACGHARTATDDGPPRPEGHAGDERRAEGSRGDEPPRDDPDDQGQEATTKAKASEPRRDGRGRAAQTRERERGDGPALPMRPAGLLRDGAAAKIRDRLAERGYLRDRGRSDRLDAETQKALADFQRASGMPPTGLPDDRTIEGLGLQPGAIFESTEKP